MLILKVQQDKDDMTKQDKRYPAFEDTDLMPFGKYGPKNGDSRALQDVPAKYLLWLKDELAKEGFDILPKEFDKQPIWKQEKYKLYNYIFNCKEALEMEI